MQLFICGSCNRRLSYCGMRQRLCRLFLPLHPCVCALFYDEGVPTRPTCYLASLILVDGGFVLNFCASLCNTCCHGQGHLWGMLIARTLHMSLKERSHSSCIVLSCIASSLIYFICMDSVMSAVMAKDACSTRSSPKHYAQDQVKDYTQYYASITLLCIAAQ